MNLQYLGEARGRWDKLSAKMKYACGSVEWLSSNLNTKATPFVCGYTLVLKSQTSFFCNVKEGTSVSTMGHIGDLYVSP